VIARVGGCLGNPVETWCSRWSSRDNRCASRSRRSVQQQQRQLFELAELGWDTCKSSAPRRVASCRSTRRASSSKSLFYRLTRAARAETYTGSALVGGGPVPPHRPPPVREPADSTQMHPPSPGGTHETSASNSVSPGLVCAGSRDRVRMAAQGSASAADRPYRTDRAQYERAKPTSTWGKMGRFGQNKRERPVIHAQKVMSAIKLVKRICLSPVAYRAAEVAPDVGLAGLFHRVTSASGRGTTTTTRSAITGNRGAHR